MNTEEQRLIKRFSELSERANSRGIWVYSDFLNMNEQSLLLNSGERNFILLGGYENAERKIAVFGNENDIGYGFSLPVKCICIKPLNAKFSDALTHRDFLGALMSLGIKREMTGDIVLNENDAYLFCIESISKYITENIYQIKHTTVSCEELESVPDNLCGKLSEKIIITASDRADAVICGVFNFSRNVCSDMFGAKKIFINGKITESPSVKLKENDLISVRGYGKFRYKGSFGETKKGRIKSLVDVFI